MHVVFICAEYPVRDRPTGGFGRYVENLSQALVGEKVEVTIICQGQKEETLHDVGRRIVVVTPLLSQLLQKLQKSPIIFIRRMANFLTYPLGFNLRAAFATVRLNREQHVDIVEGGDFGAELFFLLMLKIIRLLSFPVIIKLHTPAFLIRGYNEEPRSIFYQFMEFLEKRCLYLTDEIYSPTKSLARIVSKFIGRQISIVIPYPAKEITAGSIKKDKHLLLYVGRLQSKKGVFVLLSAFKKLAKMLPQTKLVLIGPDTLENGESVKQLLQELVTREKLDNVALLPEIAQTKLSQWYRKAAVVVVPSLWENYPNVILEALSYGTPVVASRTGGIPEIVRHQKEALLVSTADPKSLARTLVHILTKRGLASRLVKTGRQRLAMLAGPVIARKTVLYYQRVIESYAKSKR